MCPVCNVQLPQIQDVHQDVYIHLHCFCQEQMREQGYYTLVTQIVLLGLPFSQDDLGTARVSVYCTPHQLHACSINVPHLMQLRLKCFEARLKGVAHGSDIKDLINVIVIG